MGFWYSFFSLVLLRILAQHQIIDFGQVQPDWLGDSTKTAVQINNVVTVVTWVARWTDPSLLIQYFNFTTSPWQIFCTAACDLSFSVKGQDSAVYVGVTSGGIARLEFSLMLEVGQQEFLSEAPIWLTQVGSTKAHEDRWKNQQGVGHITNGHPCWWSWCHESTCEKEMCLICQIKSSQHSMLMKSSRSVASLQALSYHDKATISHHWDHFPPLPFYLCDRRW